MKISELRSKLTELESEHGDLPIYISANGGHGEATKVVFAKIGEIPGHYGIGGEHLAPVARIVITIGGSFE